MSLPRVPDPFEVAGHLLVWLVFGAGWVLARLPSPLVYSGYMVFAVWLTRWVARHVRPIPPDPNHPLVRQPGGAPIWNGILLVRSLAALVPAALGAGIPLNWLAPLWRDPHLWSAQDTLGIFGRLSMLVGGICGFLIGAICQYQLIVLCLFGFIGYGVWSVLQWVLRG